MKSLVRGFLAATLISFAAQIQAAEVLHTAYVVRVFPQSDGSIRLSFAVDHANCTNAANPKSFFIVVGQNGVTADAARAMHVTALTAFAMERQLQIAFDDSTANCYINRIQLLDQ